MLLNIAAIVLAAALLSQHSLTIQRCTVGAYFLGVLGSVFFTHLIYAIWQYILFACVYQENVAILTASNISAITSSQSNVQTFLVDSTVNAHIIEQIVIKRAIFESSRPSIERTPTSAKGDRSKSGIQHQSLMQTQFNQGQDDQQSQHFDYQSERIINKGEENILDNDQLYTAKRTTD
jgi:hypothetical protein